MKKKKVNLGQMNLLDWAKNQVAEQDRRPKEVAEEIGHEEPEQVEDKLSKSMDVPKVLLDYPIAKLDLTIRTKKLLEKMNIKTIDELLKKSEDELLKYKNIGIKSIAELNKILSLEGLSLKKD